MKVQLKMRWRWQKSRKSSMRIVIIIYEKDFHSIV
jgi:hypothetical protein